MSEENAVVENRAQKQPSLMFPGFLMFTFFCALMLPSAIFQLSEALDNPKPLEISVNEYITQKPEKHWLYLKDCYIDYAQYICIPHKHKRSIKHFYVAVHPLQDQKVIHAVIAVTDDHIENILDKAYSMPEDTQNDYLIEHRSSLEFKGVKKLWVCSLDNEDQAAIEEKFSQMGKTVSPNWTFFEERQGNNYMGSMIVIAINILNVFAVIIILAMKFFVKKKY